MKRALVLTLAGLACGEKQPAVHDAAADRLVADTPQRTPDGPPPLVVDFSVEGCPTFEPDTPTCIGPVPLALQFVPMLTAPVTLYSWDYGDMTPYGYSATPSHVYTLPGVYEVSLVVQGENGAFVSKVRTGFVTATARPIGAPCDSNEQCADKLFCVCPAASRCDHGPGQGICTAVCQSKPCDEEGQRCARLLTTPSGVPRESWETSLCLPSCHTDADCDAQLRCRSLPVDGAWAKACFSDVPSDVGDSCLDAKGALRDDLCVGGVCAGLGAKGLCTMDCSAQPCPPGSDCAVLGNGSTTLCLRPCTTNANCAPDPLIACVGPGAGDLGYQLVDPSAPDATATHCAAKECASNDDCLPSGKCDTPVGGHCIPRND